MRKLGIFCALFFLISPIFAGDTDWQAKLAAFNALDAQYDMHKENDSKEAFRISMEQEQLAVDIPIDTIKLKAHFHKTRSLHLLAFYDIALKELYKGLKEAEALQNPSFQYRYLYCIGQVYQDMGDGKQTLPFYFRAKEMAIKSKKFNDTILVNYDIAMVYSIVGEAEKALPILHTNLTAAKSIHYCDGIFFGYEALAGYYAMRANLGESQKYEKALFNYPECWGNNYRKNLLYNHLAELSKELKDWKEAQQYTDSTFKYARALGTRSWLWGCYRLQSRIDEGQGNFASALKNHKLYLATKDSVMRENYDTKMAAMTSLYDLERKQVQIDLLEKSNKLKNSQRNGILLGALLLIGGIVFFFIFKHQKEKQRLQRIFSQNILQTQEAEKQKISAELHDSIGQNILFIKNQLTNHNENNQLASVLTTVDNTISEIRNIAKDLYPNQLKKYGLAAAVNTLMEKVTENSNMFASADFEAVEAFISEENAIILYRIIQEAINNALKHSQATALRITASLHDKQIDWVIQDNGVGFDKSQLAQKQQRSFGLLSIEERVKILGGTLVIETGISQGLKLRFSMPSTN